MRNKMFMLVASAVIVFLVLVSVNLFGNGNSDSVGSADYETFKGLESLLSDDTSSYILLDVRTIEEYSLSHIPTALNTPYDVISRNLPTEDKDALIVVYCRSGRRSGIAKKTLMGLGYTNIHDFGAITKWENAFVQGLDPGDM